MLERRPLEWMEWLHSRRPSGSLWSTTCAHSTEQRDRSAGSGFPNPEPPNNGRSASRLCGKEPRKPSCGSPLNPEWEAHFEPNSYGFRPGRSVHDAIEAIFKDGTHMSLVQS